MHQELELRLAVPDASLPALQAWLETLPGAHSLHLRATYFDTTDRALARAGWGLRLRREGQRWVQTMKGPSDDGLGRPEHDVPRASLPDEAELPPLDLLAHAMHPQAAAVLAALTETPQPIFGTAIERLLVPMPRAGCALELALDRGALYAGTRYARVQELEIELKGGELPPLFDLADELMERYGLALEPRSKAARGQALARVGAVAPPDFDPAKAQNDLATLMARVLKV